MQGTTVDALTDAVLGASRALVAVAARSLTSVDHEVTLPQYRVLVVLCARGPLSMSELARELRAVPSTATRLCGRLVTHRLVTRRHRPSDRREVQVRITELGERLVREVTERRREEIESILGRIPAAEQPAMVEAFRAFADAAGEVPEQAWAIGWDL